MAPVILPLLDLGARPAYYEPYVGMGAVYLAVRASGWSGVAFLRDTNRGVTALWECLHDAKAHRGLVEALGRWSSHPRTDASWSDVVSQEVPSSPVERAATWVWLQDGAFGGVPVGCDGQRWMSSGCSFDYHAKMRVGGKSSGNTHDTSLLIKRTQDLWPLTRMAAIVEEGPFQSVTPQDVIPGSVLYCDPPYENTRQYKGAEHNLQHVNHAASFASVAKIVLSEQSALCPEGFTEAYRASRAQRVSGLGKSDCTERILVGGA